MSEIIEIIETNGIKYREIEHIHYKYQLVESYFYQTEITDNSAKTEYISLTKSGLLTLEKCYTWDGPSGSAPDLECMIRGSLFHDSLYQLIQLGILDMKWRETSDKLFRDICVEDGLGELAGEMAFWILSKFGERYARKPVPSQDGIPCPA